MHIEIITFPCYLSGASADAAGDAIAGLVLSLVVVFGLLGIMCVFICQEMSLTKRRKTLVAPNEKTERQSEMSDTLSSSLFYVQNPARVQHIRLPQDGCMRPHASELPVYAVPFKQNMSETLSNVSTILDTTREFKLNPLFSSESDIGNSLKDTEEAFVKAKTNTKVAERMGVSYIIGTRDHRPDGISFGDYDLRKESIRSSTDTEAVELSVVGYKDSLDTQSMTYELPKLHFPYVKDSKLDIDNNVTISDESDDNEYEEDFGKDDNVQYEYKDMLTRNISHTYEYKDKLTRNISHTYEDTIWEENEGIIEEQKLTSQKEDEDVKEDQKGMHMTELTSQKEDEYTLEDQKGMCVTELTSQKEDEDAIEDQKGMNMTELTSQRSLHFTHTNNYQINLKNLINCLRPNSLPTVPEETDSQILADDASRHSDLSLGHVTNVDLKGQGKRTTISNTSISYVSKVDITVRKPSVDADSSYDFF